MSTAIKDKWVRRFLLLAAEVSTWSKDPGTKVGAIIADEERQIMATGYNGFPIGMKDTLSRLADRTFKLRHTIHAEVNAILNGGRNGTRLVDTDIFVYGLPTCPDCAKAISQSGIKRVFMCCPVEKPEWAEAYEHSQLIYKEVGVQTFTHSLEWLTEIG